MSTSSYVILKDTFKEIKMNVHPSERAWSREFNLPQIKWGRATGLRNVRALILAVAAATILSACASFSIDEPKDGAIVRAPAKTKVTVIASPSMSSVAVQDNDGNLVSDVSNQINYVSDTKSEGDLSLPAGSHTITAQADVPCWYCFPRMWRASAKTGVCVAAETWPSNAPSYTALAKGDSLSWAKTSDKTVGVATDAGTPVTRWNLVRVGGISQNIGIIQSTENSCLCMTSMDSSNTIGLAGCNAQDSKQIWQAFEMPNKNGHYRFQGSGNSCLTEGPNSVLIQRSCQDTDDQLWRIRDNATGQLVTPF